MAESEDKPSFMTWISGIDRGTVTGVLTFVGGGLTAVFLAISDFGSDNEAIAAARRNHTGWLMLAAGLALVGMFMGFAYVVVAQIAKRREDAGTSGETSSGETATAAISETDSSPGSTGRVRPLLLPAVLLIGAFLVLAGVFSGVKATSDRAPGHPTIAVERVGESSVEVTVAGEGFASNDRFELVTYGFAEPLTPGKPSPAAHQLGRAMFSPGQAGQVNWTMKLSTAEIADRPAIDVVTVVVRNAAGAHGLPRSDEIRCEDPSVETCVNVILPEYEAAKPTTETTTEDSAD